jgi:tetratricopeptide (TPR) repeat protein
MRAPWLISAGLFAATLLLYSRAVDFPFLNYDDHLYVTLNPHVKGGLTGENAAWAFTTFETGNWHPLTWLSLQLDAGLFGADSAAGFHLTNAVLHATNAALLFLALRALTGALWRSALVAALFALHPLRVESVAWVAERKDVLCALFGILALLAYAHYGRRPGPGRYALVFAALLLGLLAKPMLVTLPFVLLLLDYWPLGRLSPRTPGAVPRLALEKVPLFALAAASCAVTVVAQRGSGAIRTLQEMSLGSRLAGALLAYGAYLRQTVWPVDLAAAYPYHFAPPWSGEAEGCAALLLGLTGLAVWQAGRRPYLLVGWLWYLGMLVPVIGLVQVGIQARADRYTYLPSVGLFLAAVWGAAKLLQRRPAVAAAAAVLVLCAGATWVQLGYWADNESLWRHTLTVTGPGNPHALQNLGIALLDERRPAEALPYLEAGVRLDPYNPTAHFALGRALVELGQYAKAVPPLREALLLKPDPAMHFPLARALAGLGRADEALAEFRTALPDGDGFQARMALGRHLLGEYKAGAAREQFEAAVRLRPGSAEGHLFLGLALAWEGRYDDAATCYRAALRLNPSDPAAHSHLGMALLHQGRREEARGSLERAAALAPDSALFLTNLALALSELGRDADARALYGRALRLDPKWPADACGSAWAAATHPAPPPGAVADAVAMARQACEATGGRDPESLRALAAAYAAAGRFPEAQRAQQRALDEAARTGRQELAGWLQRELQLYKSGKSLAGAG